MRRSIAPCVLGLSLLAGGSCRVTVGNPAQPATGAEPTKPAAKPSAPKVKPPSGKRTNPQETSNAQVWGHFVMATPQQSVEKIRDRLAPPPFAMFIDPAQLKMSLAGSLGASSDVGDHIDLGQPFGCAVVNASKYDEPFVCAFGYDGGLPQLIEDLGTENYESGGDGYASFRLGDERIFFRAFGSHVAVATEPTLLAATADYVDANLIRTKGNAPDMFAEARPALIFKNARPQINELLDELESSMRSKGNAPGSEYADVSAKSARQMYESFGDLKKANISFDIGKQRTKFTYRATAKEGTPTAEHYALAKAMPKVDVSLVEELPDDAFFVSSAYFDMKNFEKDPWMGPYFAAFKGLKTASGEDIGELMHATMTKWADIMKGPAAVAAFPMAKSAGVIAMSYEIEPGKDAKSVFRDFVAKYPLEKMMPSYGEWVKTSYKQDAFSVGKVKVDTYTITPTPKAKKKLTAEPDFAKLLKVTGKAQFVMAFAERDDRLYMVMTTNNAKKAMARMLGAAKGKGNLGKFGAAKKIVRKHGDGNMVTLIDISGMLDWVEGMNIEGFDRSPIKTGALDDIVLTGRMTKRGKREYEMSISQDLIEQLRSAS